MKKEEKGNKVTTSMELKGNEESNQRPRIEEVFNKHTRGVIGSNWGSE